jgi:hypothetical protein
MAPLPGSKSHLVIFSFILLPALTAFGLLLSLPNDGQSAVLFGLSKSRLMVAAVLFSAGVFLLGLAIFSLKYANQLQQWWTNHQKAHPQQNLIILSSGLVFAISYIFLGIPEKYLGSFIAIMDRLQPLLIWLLLTSLQIIAGMIVWQVYIQKKFKKIKNETFTATTITLAIMVVIWLFIAVTGLGLVSSNTFWSKNGVPLLWTQVYLALGLGLGLHYILARSNKIKSKMIWVDLCLVILIWLSAVVLWNNQPYTVGVFNTAPRPPTYEVFPINDSYIFDVAAQKMLVGQKMMADVHDKPVFISFLTILHFISGTSYSRFYLFQVMIFAFIPVCGYFIGKILHTSALGLMFAILLLLKELNAIALTNFIQVSTPMMILSEMLTTLGVLLFTLFFLKWMKSRRSNHSNLWIAGGILGLTCLVRLNSASIFPLAILLIGLVSNFKWKPWLITSIMFTAFVMISLAPWMVRNYVSSGDPINFIKNKTSGVIVNQRYDPIIDDVSPSQAPNTTNKTNYLLLGQGMATNYLHNLIGITLVMPPSLEFYNLLDLVRLPYWKLDWNGSLLPGGFWVILGVLILTSLGIATAWIRRRYAGLVPLAVILGYDITLALSLTSGGRYLVPMDWGILLYFSVGLLETATGLMILFGWLKRNRFTEKTKELPDRRKHPANITLVGLVFLLIGAVPVILESLPATYPNSVNITDFIKANRSIPEFSQPVNTDLLNTLAKNPANKVFYGKALYPRYFGENKGEGPTLEQDPLIGSTGFDRLSFLLIGGKDDVPVLLPAGRRLSALIAGADTWVVGCQRTNYIEAVFVVYRQTGSGNASWENSTEPGCE